MKGSGIAQLLSVNYKNAVLTKKPEITFFRNPQKQHTPFALDSVKEQFNEIPDFGDEVFCKLSGSGDLVESIELGITLPPVQISNTVDSSLLSNYIDTPITFDEYTLTVEQMIEQYDTLITKFKLFMSSSMIYWRGLVSLLNNSGTTYTTVTNLATSYKENQDDVQSIYEANNEFTNVKIGKTFIYFNFDIITYIITQFTSHASSVYNTTLTQLYKEKVMRYLNDYVFYQKMILQSMVDNKAMFTKVSNIVSSKYYNFAWVKNIGIALIDNIKLEIGGRIFDVWNKYTLDWYYKHNVVLGHEKSTNALLGNTPILTAFNTDKKPQTTVYVNIPFGHLVYESMSIPCTALQFQDIIIRLKISPLNECCLFEPELFSLDTYVELEEHIKIMDVFIVASYVHLSNKERENFSMKTVEMLIEQSKFLQYDNNVKKEGMYNLDFSNSIKDIQWAIQSEYNVNTFKLWNIYGYEYRSFAKTMAISYESIYSGYLIIQLGITEDSTVINPNVFINGKCIISNSKYYNGEYKILTANTTSLIIDLKQFIYPDIFTVQLLENPIYKVDPVEEDNLMIYGKDLDTPRESSYWKDVNSLTRKHSSNIHKRSIALKSDELQPSGVLNFSRIKGKHLRMKFSSQMFEYLTVNGDSVSVKILGRSYNFAVIEGGYNKLAFHY